MAIKNSQWEPFIDVCAALHKHPVSFGTKLKALRDSNRLIHKVHYLRTGEHKTSKILWDVEELTKFFNENQPKREG
tara:strand:+ start:686 stop:913 length:228 start_codon:yes stop_codon:yes gene_type:complete